MATSQVQTSTSECVLRKQSNFHTNLKVLMSSCGSDRRENGSDSDENGVVIDITDLWVHKPQYLEKTPRNDERNTSTEDSGSWGKVREIVFPGERKNEDKNKTENLPSRSDTSVVEVPHFDGISSLVRRWRDFRVVMETVNSTANNSFVSISKSNSTTSTPCDGSPLMEGLCRHHLAMGNPSV